MDYDQESPPLPASTEAVHHLSTNSVGDRDLSVSTDRSLVICNEELSSTTIAVAEDYTSREQELPKDALINQTPEASATGTNFVNLPLELRWQIWRAALPHPRILKKVFSSDTVDWSSYWVKKDFQVTWDRLTLSDIAPFITCHESWKLFQEHYEKIKLTVTQRGRYDDRGTYFDFSRDTLHLNLSPSRYDHHADGFWAPLKDYSLRTGLEKLKNLVISIAEPSDFEDLDTFSGLITMARQQYPNLKILSLNNGSGNYPRGNGCLPGKTGATIIDEKFCAGARNSLRSSQSSRTWMAMDHYLQSASTIQSHVTRAQCKDLEIRVCAMGFYEPWENRFIRKDLQPWSSVEPFDMSGRYRIYYTGPEIGWFNLDCKRGGMLLDDDRYDRYYEASDDAKVGAEMGLKKLRGPLPHNGLAGRTSHKRGDWLGDESFGLEEWFG